MPLDTIIRVVDVSLSKGQCRVAYYVEDREVPCLWTGTPPQIGDVYVIDPERPGVNARKLGSPQDWTPDNDALRWRRPLPSGLSRMEILRRRHTIKRAVRQYLDGQGFIEIDPPLLVRGTTPDIAVESFKVEDRYLATSTEYQLKRMAVGGFSRLYSLTQNFRSGDNSTVRNPEFTMLEWGRVGEDMRQIENDIESMVVTAAEDLQLPTVIDYQGHKIDLSPPWERVPVLAMIERVTGVPIKDFDAASCRKAAQAAGMDVRPDWAENRDFLFSLLMDFIQPRLGIEHPLFLTEWPMFQTTSAGADPSDPALANRSELFIGGLELGDGFAGLADAGIQTLLFEQALETRKQEGKDIVALDDKYLSAMRLGCPYGAGMAVGFDRLVMLLTNQSRIADVLAFAWEEL